MLGQEHSTQSSTKISANEDKDTSYSLSDIKSMVGLNVSPEESRLNGENSVSATVLSSEDASSTDSLIDPDDFNEAAPSKRKLWQHGWVKLTAVSVPLGFAALLLGVILVNVTSIKISGKPEKSEEVVSETQGNEAALESQRQEQEIADLKTANALGNQASVLESQPRRTEIRPQAPTEPTQRKPEATPTTEPGPTPETVVAEPRQVRSRPVAVSRPPATPRTPRVRASIPTSSSQPIRSQPVSLPRGASSEPEVDPFDAWERLAAIGSYGQVSRNDASATAIAEQSSGVTGGIAQNQVIPVMVRHTPNTPVGSVTQADYRESSPPRPSYMEENPSQQVREGNEAAQAVSDHALIEPDNALTETVDNLAPETEQEIDEQPETEITLNDLQGDSSALTVASQEYETYDDGVRFIMRNRHESEPIVAEILPGTIAKGEVVTPVAWAGDIASTAGAIELTEDLVSNDVVVMPTGTQLIVELQEMSASGMMSLTVTSIVMPDSGYAHMQIPASAISIQGKRGEVLMAREVSGTDQELRRLELNQAFLGALGQLGAVLNRPNSSINTVSVGGSANSTDYGSPSILGALLEGGANTIINQRAARNQARAEALEEKPQVWILEKDTEIEVFINQRVAL